MTTQPPRRRFVLASLSAAFFALALVCVLAPDVSLPVIWARSGLLWLFLPAWALLGLALLRRDRVAAAIAGAVVLCHVGWVAPTLVPDARAEAPSAARLRVVAANVLYVNDTPEVLLAELLATDADVLVLEEVSPRWLALLETAPVREVFPHRDVLARDDAFGIALLSRHPIERSELLDLLGVPMIDATVRVGATELRVFGVHTLPPVDRAYADVWREQLAIVRERVLAVDGPLVVVGDFNATLFHDGIRELERAGVTDAHDALGRGFASTWPNGLFPAPPVALDHVFVSPELTPVRIREGVGAGSDHRPLIVDLAPRGA